VAVVGDTASAILIFIVGEVTLTGRGCAAINASGDILVSLSGSLTATVKRNPSNGLAAGPGSARFSSTVTLRAKMIAVT
jgi:hypothetical protein